MKKLYLLSIFITFTCHLSSQVIGINTINPQRLLHIDGASSPATTNPSSGSTITDLQFSDDVIITNEGNLGVGTGKTDAKLNLKSDQPGAIRIVDGKERQFLSLVTINTAGDASWVFAGIPWFAFLSGGELQTTNIFSTRMLNNYPNSVISDLTLGNVDATNGTISVPLDGRYLVTVTGYFFNSWKTSPKLYNAQPQIYVNGTIVYTFAVTGNNRFVEGVYPNFIKELDLKNGDVIKLGVRELSYDNSNSASQITILVELIGLL